MNHRIVYECRQFSSVGFVEVEEFSTKIQRDRSRLVCCEDFKAKKTTPLFPDNFLFSSLQSANVPSPSPLPMNDFCIAFHKQR